ncbi:MAG: T9SS type A sorting domain-containing protein, partial [Bacteroidia bacterium]
VGRDTITVLENGRVLPSAWSGGLNFCEFSQTDLDLDGKKDLVAYDKINSLSYGIFRCFLNKGGVGQIKYIADPLLSAKFPVVTDWAQLNDFNGDGKADLFAYELAGIRVYKNTSTPGNLSFQLVKPLLYSDVGGPNKVNIPSSPVSIPGIADVDGDGDLDILVFSTTGYEIEYHKNQSKEMGYNTDSLIFKLDDSCWGDLSENNCMVSLSQCPLKQLYSNIVHNSSKVLHAGSCLMCFDSDNDGDQDLVMGDISCNYVNYAHNGGTTANAHVDDTTRLFPNYPAKATTVQVKLNYFPCTFNLDVDNDGKKDLIASPNTNGSENYQSVWYYNNVGTGGQSYFQFVKNNFLQEDMIEVGEGAYPVLFDNNNDGLLDLLIGNAGYYMGNTIRSRLTYYQNVGTAALPSYSLITRDFAGLSTYSLGCMVPAFGDVDGDGDTDMLIGDSGGKIHWVKNTAGPGNTCNFSSFQSNAFGISTASSNAYPQLIDVDRDGLLDLIIGTKNGRLAYYRNNGSASTPSFAAAVNNFGGVNVKGNPGLYGADGSCAPFMYDEAGSYKLLCGSISGRIFFYDNIDGNLSGNFNLIDTNVNKINDGMQCALQYVDINGDAKRDLILGNYAGGFTLYTSTGTMGINEQESASGDFVTVYPNPAQNVVMLKFREPVEHATVELLDVQGRSVLTQMIRNTMNVTINTETLARGLYLLHVNTSSVQRKMLVHTKLILH